MLEEAKVKELCGSDDLVYIKDEPYPLKRSKEFYQRFSPKTVADIFARIPRVPVECSHQPGCSDKVFIDLNDMSLSYPRE